MLRSTSKYAIADITIDFEDGTDIYWARQQVGERLAGVVGNLPPGVSGGLAPITTPLGEMFMFTIEGDAVAGREAHPARLGDPPAAAHHARRRRRQRAGRRWCAPSRSCPTPPRLAARGLTLSDLHGGARSQQPQRRRRPPGRGRGSRCWCAPKAAIRTLDDVDAIVVAGAATATRCASATSPRCASAP